MEGRRRGEAVAEKRPVGEKIQKQKNKQNLPTDDVNRKSRQRKNGKEKELIQIAHQGRMGSKWPK